MFRTISPRSVLLASVALLFATPLVALPETSPDPTTVDDYVATHSVADAATTRRLRVVMRGEGKHPFGDQPDTDDMGWRWRDRDYYRRVPAEARQLPPDWTRYPGVRFENTELGGTRRIWLHETPHFDQWLLSDPEHELRACLAVERTTRKVYFFEVKRRRGAWVQAKADDNCYSCHPSGPRVIRTIPGKGVDAALLGEFNRRILAYGACDFWGSEVTRYRGKPWSDSRCTTCHNGTARGRLYQIHRDPIRFKLTAERSMPPKVAKEN